MSKPRSWTPKRSLATPEADQATSVSYARRFGALLIDWLLCLLISGFFVKNRLIAGWVPPVVLIIEYAFFIGLFAQTPGMFVAGIRCVSASTGGRIGIARAALRGFLLCLVIPALLGWHDRVVGSVIVPGRRPKPVEERD